MQSYGTNEPRGLMGGEGSVEFPFTNHVSPRDGWSREVCEPLAHPPTHPPIPPTHPTTHPSTPPTSLSPTHPLIPITPVLFLLLLHPPTHPSTHPPTQPPIHLSTHPPIQPSTNLPTHPATHPSALTTPPTLNTSISCQMSSHIIAQHPFRIQKLMRVIWQYQNYGIPNFG